eukprot:gene109-biopygen104
MAEASLNVEPFRLVSDSILRRRAASVVPATPKRCRGRCKGGTLGRDYSSDALIGSVRLATFILSRISFVLRRPRLQEQEHHNEPAEPHGTEEEHDDRHALVLVPLGPPDSPVRAIGKHTLMMKANSMRHMVMKLAPRGRNDSGNISWLKGRRHRQCTTGTT